MPQKKPPTFDGGFCFFWCIRSMSTEKKGQVEVESDRSRVWINGESGCLARFSTSPIGTTAEFFWPGLTQTESTLGKSKYYQEPLWVWLVFVKYVQLHFGVDVSKKVPSTLRVKGWREFQDNAEDYSDLCIAILNHGLRKAGKIPPAPRIVESIDEPVEHGSTQCE